MTRNTFFCVRQPIVKKNFNFLTESTKSNLNSHKINQSCTKKKKFPWCDRIGTISLKQSPLHSYESQTEKKTSMN